MNLLNLLALTATDISARGLPHADADAAHLKTALQIFFVLIGALALLMITISGLRYVLSAGDPQRVSKAKNTLIYALVGMVIALSAEAIVALVGRNL